VNPHALSEGAQRDLSPAFSQIASVFPRAETITDAECADGASVIHMDFGNYTVGRLIPDRGNYDSKHPGYVAVRRQIEWRIGNLGYKKEQFENVAG
jgi:hypothetical protein